jgi:hypothetical protein
MKTLLKIFPQFPVFRALPRILPVLLCLGCGGWYAEPPPGTIYYWEGEGPFDEYGEEEEEEFGEEEEEFGEEEEEEEEER